MRMADFWLTEKVLIPKLFKVLAPRFQDQNGGYKRMLHIPNSKLMELLSGQMAFSLAIKHGLSLTENFI
ncbi:39S ribosomal protein L17, mitochondrial [Cricetulus griseus]|uniref:Large ribosomal subunit protein bL17m n=1 Tax=Cricetulus griseus TaxID=10029 RepID=G3IFF0_CRIGR|nr:39S ribosomal protein L17, mitochondrial [Cricetulus griseus]